VQQSQQNEHHGYQVEYREIHHIEDEDASSLLISTEVYSALVVEAELTTRQN